MPIVTDPSFQPSTLPGAVRSELFRQFETEEKPSLLQTLQAANIESNLVGASLDRLHEPDVIPAQPGERKKYFLQKSQQFLEDDGINADFDPLDYAEGYEDYADDLAYAKDPAEFLTLINRIDRSRENRDVLRRAGWVGTSSDMAAALIDPTLLVAWAIPEMSVAKYPRLARAVTAAVQGTAATAVYEGGLQALSETRSAEQSLFNIGAGTVIGGVLGSFGRGVPKKEMRHIEQAVEAEMQGLERSAGAMAVRAETTLERESLAAGAREVSAAMEKVPLLGTDLNKIMASEFVAAKEGLQDLADISAQIGKNLEGERTAVPVEAFVLRHEARVADFSDEAARQWKVYRDRVPRQARMNRDAFYENIAKASRRDDAHAVPEVETAARFLRAKVFEPLKNEAEQWGLFAAQKEGGELGQVVGAPSYFRRMYDRRAILGNRTEWNRVLTEWFSRNGDALPAEIEAAVRDVTNKIIHADVGVSNWGNKITVKTAGPLKERVLDIPDELIEQFLTNDPLKVARAYVRDLAPQVELAKRFHGDVEMKSVMQRIEDEAGIKAHKVSASNLTEKQKNARLKEIDTKKKEAQEALVRVRDRVANQAGRLSPTAGEGQRRAAMAARNWRNVVMSAKGGGIAVTGGAMDLARIIAHNGFAKTMGRLSQMAASKEFREYVRKAGRRAGAVVEVALSRRAQIAYDGAITEGWSQKLAEGVFKYTGINHIMDFNRMLSASLFEDRVLNAAQKAAKGSLKKADMAELASLHLGEKELKAIARQVEKHGGEVDGIRVSGSADWDDQALAELYDMAVLKESRIAVSQPGAADRVWWMDNELGKLIGQLKTFSLAAPIRMASLPAQQLAQGQFGKAARFVGFMMIGGYLTHAVRQTLANRPIETSPSGVAAVAFSETGIAGVLPDLLNPWGSKFAPEYFGKMKYSDRNAMGAYGGPAIGSAMDVWDILYNRTEGGISANDLHSIRRMLPYQNAWMFRRAVNAIEGETAEALGLQGATADNFVERLNQ